VRGARCKQGNTAGPEGQSVRWGRRPLKSTKVLFTSSDDKGGARHKVQTHAHAQKHAHTRTHAHTFMSQYLATFRLAGLLGPLVAGSGAHNNGLGPAHRWIRRPAIVNPALSAPMQKAAGQATRMCAAPVMCCMCLCVCVRVCARVHAVVQGAPPARGPGVTPSPKRTASQRHC